MLASAVRTVVATFALEIPPDIAQVVSITEVRVSDDLLHATVFVTALAGCSGAIKYLRAHKGVIKREITRAVQTQKVPELQFKLDTHTEKVSRLEELLS